MDEVAPEQTSAEPDVRPEVIALDTLLPIEVRGLPKFDKGFRLSVREAKLLQDPPWVRTLGKLNLEVATDGWRFPAITEQGSAAEPPPEKLVPPKIAV
ncbi:hypothetical protein BH10PLA2_BH10PLA2_38180 [soil metagenome]